MLKALKKRACDNIKSSGRARRRDVSWEPAGQKGLVIGVKLFKLLRKWSAAGWLGEGMTSTCIITTQRLYQLPMTSLKNPHSSKMCIDEFQIHSFYNNKVYKNTEAQNYWNLGPVYTREMCTQSQISSFLWYLARENPFSFGSVPFESASLH